MLCVPNTGWGQAPWLQGARLSMRHTFQIQMPHQQINLQERDAVSWPWRVLCCLILGYTLRLRGERRWLLVPGGIQTPKADWWVSHRWKGGPLGHKSGSLDLTHPCPLHITSFHPHARLPCFSLSNFLPRFPFSPRFLTPYFSSLLSLCLSLPTWPLPGSLAGPQNSTTPNLTNHRERSNSPSALFSCPRVLGQVPKQKRVLGTSLLMPLILPGLPKRTPPPWNRLTLYSRKSLMTGRCWSLESFKFFWVVVDFLLFTPSCI